MHININLRVGSNHTLEKEKNSAVEQIKWSKIKRIASTFYKSPIFSACRVATESILCVCVCVCSLFVFWSCILSIWRGFFYCWLTIFYIIFTHLFSLFRILNAFQTIKPRNEICVHASNWTNNKKKWPSLSIRLYYKASIVPIATSDWTTTSTYFMAHTYIDILLHMKLCSFNENFGYFFFCVSCRVLLDRFCVK